MLLRRQTWKGNILEVESKKERKTFWSAWWIEKDQEREIYDFVR